MTNILFNQALEILAKQQKLPPYGSFFAMLLRYFSPCAVWSFRANWDFFLLAMFL